MNSSPPYARKCSRPLSLLSLCNARSWWKAHEFLHGHVESQNIPSRETKSLQVRTRVKSLCRWLVEDPFFCRPDHQHHQRLTLISLLGCCSYFPLSCRLTACLSNQCTTHNGATPHSPKYLRTCNGFLTNTPSSGQCWPGPQFRCYRRYRR